jgi:hypothetical protein
MPRGRRRAPALNGWSSKWIVSPTFLNTFRGGYTAPFSWKIPFRPVPPRIHPGILAGAPYSGNIQFSAAAVDEPPVSADHRSLAGQGAGGCCLDRHYGGNQFDFSDQLFVQRGAHALTIGGHLQKIQHNVNFNLGQLGTFSFASLQSFLQGTPTQFIGINPNDPNCPLKPYKNLRGETVNGCASADKGYREIYFDTYIQDDYKLRRNLTLNLGVRYELMTVPYGLTGASPTGGETVRHLRVSSTPFWAIRCSRGPRLDRAADRRSLGRVRQRQDGRSRRLGIFTTSSRRISRKRWRTILRTSTCCRFRTRRFRWRSPGAARAACPAVGLDPGAGADPVPSTSVALQQQIGRSMAVNIGYVGDHIRHLTHSTDMNSAVPQVLPGKPRLFVEPVLLHAPGSPARNPAVAATNILVWDGRSSYPRSGDWVLRHAGFNNRCRSPTRRHVWVFDS